MLVRNRIGVAVMAAGLGLACLSTPSSRATVPTSAPATQPAPRSRAATSFLDRVRRSVGELKLDDEQKKKAQALLDKAGSDLKSTADRLRDNAQERGKQAGEVLQKLRQDLGNVLTDEQKQELQQKLQSLTRPGLLERLTDQFRQLDLSKEQKQKIEDIYNDARLKLEDLAEQARNGSREAREKMLDVFSETQRKMREVLTPEQQQKMRERLSPRRGSTTQPQGK